MIVVLCRDGIDKQLAKKVSLWLCTLGHVEFYITHADC